MNRPPLDTQKIIYRQGKLELREAYNEINRLKAEIERWKERFENADFWSNIVYPAGAKAADIQNELVDYSNLMDRASKVYCHVTHGMISKLNTVAETVIQVADEKVQDIVNEETKELQSEINRLQTENDKLRKAADQMVRWAWTTSFNGNSAFGWRMHELRQALGLTIEELEPTDEGGAG